MLLTIDEASEKTCPFLPPPPADAVEAEDTPDEEAEAPTDEPDEGVEGPPAEPRFATCIGDACAAWRWDRAKVSGYCGAAGIPIGVGSWSRRPS
jgi:hypothetical protein